MYTITIQPDANNMSAARTPCAGGTPFMTENQFINADCIQTLRELPDQSIDAVITDPPYPNRQGLFGEDLCDGYAGLYLSAKKTKSVVVFFWGIRVPPPFPPPGWFEVAKHVWHKPDCKSIDHYELIIVWSREYKRKVSRVWTIPILEYRTLFDWQPHPTQKPVKLIRYLLDLYTQEGNTVLDPFAGSGTTAVACVQTKRSYLAIEKNTEFADAAKKRLQQQRGLPEFETPEVSTPVSEPITDAKRKTARKQNSGD